MFSSPNRLIYMLKRVFDIALSIVIFPIAFVVMIFIAVAVKVTSPGPVLFVSDRVGRGKQIFKMLKVRTMRTDTPQLATHLLSDPDAYLTSIGKFLRKTSLDELPQLYNIVKGDMSFIGPRPALFNQDDLVALRDEHGINDLVPGLTGWAQINGRDDLSIPEKVKHEEYYKNNRSFWFDIYILFVTLRKAVSSSGVRH